MPPETRGRVANGPREYEPAWLQRSLDRYYTWGLVFMTVLIVGFPLYRWREPHLRSSARVEQQTNYITTGSKLFSQNCASCHGANATGGTGPTLNAKEFLTTTSDAQIGLLVTGGVSGTSMSAWSLDYGGSLTDEQIRQLTTFLRSLQSNAPSIPGWRTGTTSH
jgi:mono/diheme cytochrome c family protein